MRLRLTVAATAAAVLAAAGLVTATAAHAAAGCGLTTPYSGSLPSGYSPMKTDSSLLLGTGGDNSVSGQGEFFEGAITSGYPSDATENAVQASIVAAGYQ